MVQQLNSNQNIPAIEGPQGIQQNYITDDKAKVKTLKEAYYQWVSRLTMLVCIVSLAFFTLASLVLFRMAPRVMVEPFLIINQDDSETMVRYETISQKMASRKQMMETFIRQYVIVRNAVLNDQREMQARWFAGGIVNYLSSPSVYIDFNKSKVVELNNLIKDGVVRDVEIISVSKVGGEKSPVWKIDFRTYEIVREQKSQDHGRLVLKTRYWTASLTAYFIKQRMFMSRRLMNPLGFTVVRYSQTEVEIL